MLSEQEIIHQYKGQLNAAREILELVRAEENALKSRQIDKIESCLANKASLLDKFETDCNHLLGIDVNEARDAAGKTTEINSLRSDLKTLILEIQQQSRINAGIANLFHDFSKSILNIIRNAETDQSTYDASGNSTPNNGNHSLAKV